MRYDITTKILLEHNLREIVGVFTGLELESVEMIRELPERMVLSGSVDFPLLVRQAGEESIFLLEIQTTWQSAKPARFAMYYLRFREKYPGRLVRPYMILFEKSDQARELFRTEYLTFGFHLVKLWELSAEAYRHGPPGVLPFVPLMDDGLTQVPALERRIVEETTGQERSDLLAGLAVFTGLKDLELARALFRRGSMIMKENPFIEWLREEFREEAMKEGRAVGWQEGLEEGRKAGRIEGRDEGRREGRQEGRQAGALEGYAARAREIARRLALEGVDRETILRVTELTEGELDALIAADE